MAQRQHEEQQELMERQKKEQELKDSPVEKLKEILFQAKDAIVVMVLVIMFNLEPISEIIKFKSVPFFYNIETDKVEITGIILKSFIIASIFLSFNTSLNKGSLLSNFLQHLLIVTSDIIHISKFVFLRYQYCSF